MDQNILNQLQNSGLSDKDLGLLTSLMSSVNGGKKPKMSVQDRNRILSKLSSTMSNIPTEPPKDIKDMTEEEKIKYKEENRKKLQNKMNQFKLNRSSKKHRESVMNNNDISNNLNNLPASTTNNLPTSTNRPKKLHEMTEEEKNKKREEIRLRVEEARRKQELEEKNNSCQENEDNVSKTLEKDNSSEEDLDDYIN